jgi:hypothetical protein
MLIVTLTVLIMTSFVIFFFVNNNLLADYWFCIPKPKKDYSDTHSAEKYKFASVNPSVAFEYSTRPISKIFHQANCCSSDYWDATLKAPSLTYSQLEQYFLWTNQSSCQLSHAFGGKIMQNPSGIAGQKSVCIDSRIAPIPSQCLVYSFGISNEWSFDEQMELYGCEVYSFDPSMELYQHNHSHGIHFYNWGLADRDEYDEKLNWTVRSLSSIYKELSALHGSNIIDYLKIDIEYSEWTALPQIIMSGMLPYIRQLGIEIHLDPHKSIDQHREWAKILRLIEKYGMIRFDSKYNPWFTGIFGNSFGYEIAWYNNNVL